MKAFDETSLYSSENLLFFKICNKNKFNRMAILRNFLKRLKQNNIRYVRHRKFFSGSL